MKKQTQQFRNEFIKEAKFRLLEESVPRLKKCLHQLTIEEIWYRPNNNSNSMGNLVLHLCGNVRQWILSALGGHPDTRQRQSEFDESGPITTEKLLQDLDEVMLKVERLFDSLTAEDLLKVYQVQGVFETSGIGIIIHVVEHFSYHVGQMTYFVKWRKDMDIGYYEGIDLNEGE